MRRLLSAFVLSLLVVSCAAGRKTGAAEPASPAAQDAAATPAATGGAEPGGYPQQQPGNAYAPPPPAQPSPAPEPAKPSGAATPGTPSRGLAIQQASNDIEGAQRELDVAGSSCQNACRALGSMDRAAGHLCQLTRDDTTHDRCDDAKRRLYNARDRVKSTCGSCPDNQPAVDRNAPVPSMR